MSQASGSITLVRGEAEIDYTITVKRAGSAVNLTGYTVTFFAHADGDNAGTNAIDASACTLTDAANGVVTHTFTSAHTAIASSQETLKGDWRLRLVNGSLTEWTKKGDFVIEGNNMVAVTS